MAIARFLASVVNPRATAITRGALQRRALFDYGVSFGVPTIVAACHILYQYNRYSISNGIGCLPTVSTTWPALVLWMVWPPIFAIIGTLYMCQSQTLLYDLTVVADHLGSICFLPPRQASPRLCSCGGRRPLRPDSSSLHQIDWSGGSLSSYRTASGDAIDYWRHQSKHLL